MSIGPREIKSVVIYLKLSNMLCINLLQVRRLNIYI